MLDVKAATRVFYKGQPDEKVALDNLSLHLAPADFAVVIGSNGAGKSSLLNAISGALMLDSGRITIHGKDVTELPVHRRAIHVACVFQDPMKGTAASMTVAENMLLAELRHTPRRLRPGLTKARRENYREQLSYLHLGLEDRLDTTVALLSGGQRQSLSLVMAVSGTPDLLLLDEHTAALDPRTAELVLDATVRAVTALKLTTLMVTHNMKHAIDYGNRVVMLDRGKVKLELTGEAKSRATVPDLIAHFSVKTDRMLLEFVIMYDLAASIISTFYTLIPVTLAQSLLLSFVVLGIMISFRVLNFPDLTSEGAYPLGGCVCALALIGGAHPVVALIAAALAGFAAGCTTAFIHLRFRIHTLLAGILMMTMLYSINLRIMGRSNVPVFDSGTVFAMLPDGLFTATVAKIVVAGLVAVAVFAVLHFFFLTERGTAVRAVGANPDMAEAQGINVWTATIGGIGLAGGFSALSGGLMVQSQGFADVNMGLGILINGLAALMIGEAITGKRTVFRQLLAPFVGAIVYYQLISVCLAAGMPPGDLKLATGLFVLVMLAGPALRGKHRGSSARETMRE